MKAPRVLGTRSRGQQLGEGHGRLIARSAWAFPRSAGGMLLCPFLQMGKVKFKT